MRDMYESGIVRACHCGGFTSESPLGLTFLTASAGTFRLAITYKSITNSLVHLVQHISLPVA